jgi:hypothetical protein
MAGVKGKSGGWRPNSGRDSKSEEQELIKNLTPMHPKALSALEYGLTNKEAWAVKMFMDYFYGKPTDKLDVVSNGQTIGQAQEVVIKDYSKK